MKCLFVLFWPFYLFFCRQDAHVAPSDDRPKYFVRSFEDDFPFRSTWFNLGWRSYIFHSIFIYRVANDVGVTEFHGRCGLENWLFRKHPFSIWTPCAIRNRVFFFLNIHEHIKGKVGDLVMRKRPALKTKITWNKDDRVGGICRRQHLWPWASPAHDEPQIRVFFSPRRWQSLSNRGQFLKMMRAANLHISVSRVPDMIASSIPRQRTWKWFHSKMRQCLFFLKATLPIQE